MIAALAGWQRRTVAGGAMLVAPDLQLGTIRIRVHVPLRPLGEVVAEMIQPGFMGAPFVPRTPARALVTGESEYAAIYDLVARPPGLEVRRAIALLIGDHELVTIDGHAVRPEGHDIAQKVTALTSSFALGLGTDRWRRCFYAPPAGWHRLARFHADVWLAPDYPLNSGVITVFHARSSEGAEQASYARTFEHLGSEYGRTAPLEQRPVTLPSGLTGESLTHEATVNGKTRHAINVSLSDNRTLYTMRLESDAQHSGENARAFNQMMASAEPLPTARSTAEPFSQWSE